jgi:methylated-DNA-[protein]-cysteine S-methyltransferase
MNSGSSPSQLLLDHAASPIGTFSIVCDERGCLRALEFEGQDARLRKFLRLHYGDRGETLRDGPAPRAIVDVIDAYFAGDLSAIDETVVETAGTEFQRSVWNELRRIPAGTTISYGELSVRVGNPRASRAVGLANGSNPVVLVQPCHRVIGANGSLTGFGGGLERKRWLLAHERRWAGDHRTVIGAVG